MKIIVIDKDNKITRVTEDNIYCPKCTSSNVWDIGNLYGMVCYNNSLCASCGLSFTVVDWDEESDDLKKVLMEEINKCQD